jgi:hypothetical protein
MKSSLVNAFLCAAFPNFLSDYQRLLFFVTNCQSDFFIFVLYEVSQMKNFTMDCGKLHLDESNEIDKVLQSKNMNL